MNKTFSNKNTSPKNPEISVLLPCLNEEKSISYCLAELRETLQKMAKNGNVEKCEVIVIDNGSTDGSAALVLEIAKTFPGLQLVQETMRGYGSAYMRGLAVARGKYIFMADIDGSYDLRDLPKFISKLKEGYGLVIGNRFSFGNGGGMENQSMPWHHRHIGNPFLSYLVRLFFGVKVRDIHCGMRALTREATRDINPHAAGMEFASEMIVKAAKRKIPMTEIPITYRKRIGESKLRSFADGWRHLRFLLIYCPTALFFVPGAALLILGTLVMAILYFANPTLFGLQFYFHPMFLAAAMIIIGYQFIFFGGFARIYASTHLGDSDRTLERLFRYVTIEKAGMLGIIIVIVGLGVYVALFLQWIHSGFSFGTGLGSANEVKNSIVALTLVVVGMETISSAFMLSILGIREK